MTYAPYSYYSDVAKVRISVEKIEQAFSEARLSSSMGLSVPGTDANADAYLVLLEGTSNVGLYAAKSGSGFAPQSEFRLLRDIPLEKDIEISRLPSPRVTVKFSAPSGAFSAVDQDGVPLVFTGGTLGLHGAVLGTLIREFRSVSAF